MAERRFSEDEPVMVSIRCITYNHAPYIRQCLDGFVMQKTNFRFQAVVHDDASTDGTTEIVREYAEKYPDIIIPMYEEENRWSKHDGTLLTCMLPLMTGKYWAECEGDDYWIDPYKLQKQVDFLETHPDYGLVRTNVNRFYQDTQEIEKDIFSNKEWRGMKDTHEDYILNRWFAAPCTWLWLTELKREEALSKSGDCFTGDLALLLAFSKQKKIKYLSDTTAVYRVLKKSSSHFDNPLQEMNFWLRLKNTRLYFAQYCSFVVKLEFSLRLIKEYAYRIKQNRNRLVFLVRTYMKDINALFF